MRPVDERQDTGGFPGFGRGDDPWGERTGPSIEVRTVVPRARTGLVLLVAFVTQGVIILVVGNQFIADKIRDTRPSSLMLTGVRNAAVNYNWRASPDAGDTAHRWLAQTIAVPSAVVLSLLLIAAIVRSSVTFWRAFFGIWMAVAVSAMLGGYVRGLIIDPSYQVSGPQPSRAEYALFGPGQPTSTTFLAGVVLGLVTALVAGIVARATRRTPEPDVAPAPLAAPAAAPPPPEQPPPFNPAMQDTTALGRRDDAAPWQDRNYGPPARSESAGGAAPWAAPFGRGTSEEPREQDEQAGARGQDSRTSALPSVADDDVTRADTPVARDQAEARPVEDDADAVTARHDPVTPTEQGDPDTETNEHDLAETPDEDAPTQAHPVAAEQGAQRADEAQGPVDDAAHQTAQFPRPPDDENIGEEFHPEHR